MKILHQTLFGFLKHLNEIFISEKMKRFEDFRGHQLLKGQ